VKHRSSALDIDAKVLSCYQNIYHFLGDEGVTRQQLKKIVSLLCIVPAVQEVLSPDDGIKFVECVHSFPNVIE
jgi:hypothetical protein